MDSNCKFEIGQVVTNADIVSEFRCGNMGGMRRAKATNSLIIVSDPTKAFYEDKWYGNILHYTGMGKTGDQSLYFGQNKTLAESDHNGIKVHLFEVLIPTQYIYRGLVQLVDPPYQETQIAEDGVPRTVWMFPLKLQSGSQEIPKTTLDQHLRRKEATAAKLSQAELRRRAEAKGSNKVGSRTASNTVYIRDPDIAEYAKRRANGICQLCGQKAPFLDKDKKPYMECHHIDWLSEGGSDTIQNTVALCPNCHRKMHILNFPEDKKKLKIQASKE